MQRPCGQSEYGILKEPKTVSMAETWGEKEPVKMRLEEEDRAQY